MTPYPEDKFCLWMILLRQGIAFLIGRISETLTSQRRHVTGVREGVVKGHLSTLILDLLQVYSIQRAVSYTLDLLPKLQFGERRKDNTGACC